MLSNTRPQAWLSSPERSFSKQGRQPFLCLPGTVCCKAGQARLWGGGTKTEVIKQPDLVLVQHRKESVSVTSHYGLREGWGRELTNNLKEITNTFTSHKPPMSTKWSRKYSCGFMEGKNWSPCFQHRRHLFSSTLNIWHWRKLAVDRRWEKERRENHHTHLSYIGLISKSISLPLLYIFLLPYYFSFLLISMICYNSTHLLSLNSKITFFFKSYLTIALCSDNFTSSIFVYSWHVFSFIHVFLYHQTTSPLRWRLSLICFYVSST